MNAGPSNLRAEQDQRFSKRVRLLRPSDFERVFKARNSASDAWIVLYGATSETGHPRIGLTVSRKVGGAVVRNRWKRLLRESFRLTQSQLPPLDLVCVVRGQAQPTLAQLRTSLTGISKRIQSRIDRRVDGRAGRPS